MPLISSFYGLEISFRFNDHEPPHVHVWHEGDTSMVSIETGEVMQGNLKGAGKNMIKDWVTMHHDELMEIWETKETKSIPPLE